MSMLAAKALSQTSLLLLAPISLCNRHNSFELISSITSPYIAFLSYMKNPDLARSVIPTASQPIARAHALSHLTPTWVPGRNLRLLWTNYTLFAQGCLVICVPS